MPDEEKKGTPWVGMGDLEWKGALLGNRRGLELLKDGIERALASDADAALIDERGFPLERVQVMEKDPRPVVEQRKGRDWKGESRELMWLLLMAAVGFVILMVFGMGLIFIWKLAHGTVQ